ncbi:8699_t:CDS:2 [Ambispora leptoticha]|uniref:8699_t:CDS:1 n=1 Tax=Ambispora leptoticha TaxID=144679 RepID=A0A9N9B216_9GLOM|nr:8699_t:CDS:2 [Ambispora leptoticha]
MGVIQSKSEYGNGQGTSSATTTKLSLHGGGSSCYYPSSTTRGTLNSSTRRSRFRTLRNRLSTSSSQTNDSSSSDTYRFADGRRFLDSSKNANSVRSTSDYYMTMTRGSVGIGADTKENNKNSNRIQIIEDVEKLKQQHHLFKRVWNGNYSAPVKMRLRDGAAKVLDVGCGTGTWVLEMAKDYPASAFTGIDLAPVFPSSSPNSNNSTSSTEKKLMNVRFLQCDVLDGLPFPDNTFDYIHMRRMITSFKEQEFQDKILPELVRVLRPGGWVEIVEIDNELCNGGTIATRLTTALYDYLYTHEVIAQISTLIPKHMESTKGLSNLQILEKSCFLGKWAGKLGQLALEDVTKSFKSLRQPLSKDLHITTKEYDELVRQFNKELEQSHRTISKMWRFFARKSVADNGVVSVNTDDVTFETKTSTTTN